MASIFDLGGYQDRQIDILKSIDKSLGNTLNLSMQVARILDRAEYAITSMAHTNEVTAKNIELMTRDWTGSAHEFTSRMDEASLHVRDFSENLEESSDEVDEFRSNLRLSGKELTDMVGKLAEGADKFSKISNDMIKNSSLHGDAVREFKTELMSTIADLNLDTGSLYSPAAAYETISNLSQSVTSNIDSLQEMARPLLLAQETMNVELESVAELFDRFYVKYNFNSAAMEEVLGGIKNNTAGNAATAEATMKNFATLEDWINNRAGSDNNLRQDMLEKLSKDTSWLQSMYLDSNMFAEYMAQAASGNWNDNLEILLGMTSSEAMSLAREGDLGKFSTNMIEKFYEIIAREDKNRDGTIGDKEALALAEMEKAMNIPAGMLMKVWNAKNHNWVGYNDFVPGDDSTLEESAASKHVSLAEKTNNWLEQIYSVLASTQEFLGFSFSDLAILGSVLGTRGGGGGAPIGSRLLSGIRSAGSASATSTTLASATGVANSSTLGGISSLGGGIGGAAMMAGGTLAGGLLFTDGLQDAFDEGMSAGTRMLGAAEAGLGLAGAVGTVAAVSNPIGWALLAAGGATALGKAWYEHANGFSGNAKEVQAEISEIGKSIEKENHDRLLSLSELQYQFEKENDVDKQRELIKRSGLISEQDLIDTANEDLDKLIQSYMNAASSMDQVTDNILKIADKWATEEQTTQQKGFAYTLKENFDKYSQEQINAVLSQLKVGTSDEELMKKIEKAQENGFVSQYEWNDILTGGGNAWFDEHTLSKQSISTSILNSIANTLGLDTEFKDKDYYTEATKLYLAFSNALSDEERKKAYEAIQKSGLESVIREEFGNDIFKVHGYAQGTNYIPHDQFALLHEGEAVIPKRYNPAADIDYKKTAQESNNQLKELIEEIKEIKLFLSEWKLSDDRKDVMNNAKNKFSAGRNAMQSYLQV